MPSGVYNRPSLVGQRFGNLAVESLVGKKKHGSYLWLCKCDCGRMTTTNTSHLRTGGTQSCGCLQKQRQLEVVFKHGMSKGNKAGVPEYEVWRSMKRRCTNPNEKAYKHYGGRGIVVCKRWSEYGRYRK